MNVRLHTLALAGVALLAPSLALAAGTLEGFYGIARPPNKSFSSSVSGAQHDQHLFNDSQQIAGADLMFNVGVLQFGAIADHTWAKDKASQTALGGLLGFKLGAGPLRIDLMGEAGAHRFGDLGSVSSSNKDQWLAYVGLRPGIAFKLAAPDQPGMIIGVWTFARWDLSSTTVPVTAGNVGNTTPNSLKLGGTTIGATLRLGFDF